MILRHEFEEVLSDCMAAAIVSQRLPSDFQVALFISGDVGYEVIKDRVLQVQMSKKFMKMWD